MNRKEKMFKRGGKKEKLKERLAPIDTRLRFIISINQ